MHGRTDVRDGLDAQDSNRVISAFLGVPVFGPLQDTPEQSAQLGDVDSVSAEYCTPQDPATPSYPCIWLRPESTTPLSIQHVRHVTTLWNFGADSSATKAT